MASHRSTRLIASAAPGAGDHVVHVGAGVGYYTAILAELSEASGAVTAIEYDAGLAARAAANLARWTNIRVMQGDGASLPFEPADVIYVNAVQPDRRRHGWTGSRKVVVCSCRLPRCPQMTVAKSNDGAPCSASSALDPNSSYLGFPQLRYFLARVRVTPRQRQRSPKPSKSSAGARSPGYTEATTCQRSDAGFAHQAGALRIVERSAQVFRHGSAWSLSIVITHWGTA